MSINPITRARNFSYYTSSQLAKELQVSKQYMNRVEQGIYDKPNNRVLDWAAEELNKTLEFEVTGAKVLAAYKSWQWDKRMSVKEDKSLRPVEINQYHNPEIIHYYKLFKEWRERYWNTAHAFSVDMCIHPDSVNNYENGKFYKMPLQLKEIMSRLGLIGQGFKTNER